MTSQQPATTVNHREHKKNTLGYGLLWLTLFVATLGASGAKAQDACTTTITANVVVLDNPTVFNRLGAQNPNWIIYALERDVVDKSSQVPCSKTSCSAGNVELRPDKRPRPLVVRSVAGACLDVNFTNLLDPIANPNNGQDPRQILGNNDQVAGRCAGFHATGTELRGSMLDDGSMVGNNHPDHDTSNNCGSGDQKGGLVGPNNSITYKLYTPHEGAFIINSYGATIGSEQSGGNLGMGMFGALNVEPPGASMYRGQVTEEELRLATTGRLESGHPVIDYETLYPNEEPWISEGKAGLPVLNMLTADNELVHADINAIIVGTGGNGRFDEGTYPLEANGKFNPVYPNRLEPFREFTSIYHDEQANSQVFPRWYNDPVLGFTLDGVPDAFMINYGSGGIGSEIIANRLHTGPMHDCTDCAYEEFFLSSSTVGDPGMLVKYPANTEIEACSPDNILSEECWRQFDDPDHGLVGANPPIPGNHALYSADPYGVHHAYTGDHVKIRNIHAGAFEQHIFHLHNHQWLFNPDDDNANYLDAQEIFPGSGHTYELVNGGAGNRNKTAGDAIFHCHFYPHFAQGMWYHIRIKDVMETGTVLSASKANDPQKPKLHKDSLLGDKGLRANFHENPWDLRSGQPAAGARALPDGELLDGVPIPAIVPLPGKAMPPMPAKVHVEAVDRGDYGVLTGRRPPDGLGQGADSSQAFIDWTSVAGKNGTLGDYDDLSPGYPFWLAGVSCGEKAQPGNAENPQDHCPQGIVGQRMPTPPLDMLTADGVAGLKLKGDLWANASEGQAGGWDGGLPRHALLGYTAGGTSLDTQNRLDFRKVIKVAQPVYYKETGTMAEQASMRHHSVREHASWANTLVGTGTTQKDFILNGALPVPGGPFNDPCVDDTGAALTGDLLEAQWFGGPLDNGNPSLKARGQSDFTSENPRTFRIANIQVDAVFNKAGYHYPQERIITLWGDVQRTIDKQRPPEPLVMRFNTFDCGRILHTNLVPHEYELDDFQVRTPTDIIGQHIHLPKWDLTTNDGAANGWNYEDGTLAPGIVQERIEAINKFNELADKQANGEAPTKLVDFLAAKKIAVQEDLAIAVADHTIDLTGLKPVPTIDTGDSGAGADGYDYADGLGVPGKPLKPLPHPYFGTGTFEIQATNHLEYEGARTTIQRILVDPVLNTDGVDRGLGLTFSHDHYGPSTHQQIGLYSTILAEPAGSTWVHNETGEQLGQGPDGVTDGGRTATPLKGGHLAVKDGGPTSWQAAILTPSYAPGGSNVGAEDVPTHREFYFEMSDFQHAYEKDTYVGAGPDGRPLLTTIEQPEYFDATKAYANDIQDAWKRTVNPPLKLKSVPFPDIVTAEAGCPGPAGNFDPSVPRPCAEAINISHSSLWVVNYRNEPIGLRVFDPSKPGPDGRNGMQADGKAGDLAFAFQTRKDRAISQFNTSFGDTPYEQAPYCKGNGDGINCDRNPGDPFTPIMRAYEADHVKIKIQVGATEEQHQTTVHGLKWLSNGSAFGRSPNSGWRNFQSHGISEQFTLSLPVDDDPQQRGNVVDYMYMADATRDGVWSGTWGILRKYSSPQSDLFELPTNRVKDKVEFVNRQYFDGVCPKYELDEYGDPIYDISTNKKGKERKSLRSKVPRTFQVAAVLANDVLPNELGVRIPTLSDTDQFGQPFGRGTVGGPLDPEGGTLVYNRRTTNVPDADIAEGGVVLETLRGGDGPLNDPTAMMYVRVEDLVPRWVEGTSPDANTDLIDDRCQVEDTETGGYVTDVTGEGCPVALAATAPVEPLALRANAGDCIEITLLNKLVDQATDKDSGKPLYSCDVEVDPVTLESHCALGTIEAMYELDEDIDEDGDGEPEMTLAQAIEMGKKRLVYGDGSPAPSYPGGPYDGINFDEVPDLGGWQDMFWVVNRDLYNPTRPPEMHFFNNNLIRPSKFAGLHPQLVEFDMSRGDGVAVGGNSPALANPGASTKYQYYAGDLRREYVDEDGSTRRYKLRPTPIEFGGTNLLSADRVKQPQKGLFGALVIEPAEATWPDALDELEDVPDTQGTGSATRKTRAQLTVTAHGDPDPEANWAGTGGVYRENLLISQKITNLRWKDGTAIANIHQGELGREGAEDSGHAGINYGMEPSWFRFGLPPDVPFGNAGTPNSFGSIPNVHAMYANGLVLDQNGMVVDNAIPRIDGVSEAGDPATPVFRARAGDPTRIHLLNGASADRDSVFVLHGHLWQRDPFVCREAWQDDNIGALKGRCDYGDGIVGSQAIGLNPTGKWMGSEEGMGHVYGHWPILFDAGGSYAVEGDYLYRDYAPNGNRNGMFGLLRVGEFTGDAGNDEPPPPPPEDPPQDEDPPDEEEPPKEDNPNKGRGKKK